MSLALICMFIFTLIPFFLWLFFGREGEIKPVINIYPPEKKNSAELGVEYRTFATNIEIISLIFYLANKGYIEIKDDNHNFELRKIKEYEGTNATEKELMDALFKNKDIVTKKELRYSHTFYENCFDIKKGLNKLRKFIIYEKSCSAEKVILCLISIIGIIVLILKNSIEDSTLGNPVACLGFSIVVTVIFALIFSAIDYKNKKPVLNLIFAITVIGLFSVLSHIFFETELFKSYNVPFLYTGLICLTISIICSTHLQKRNKNGRLALGHILGFKKFLEETDKHRLELQIEENPSYFYDILPYAYVLDVSDTWIDKFENIVMETPEWYKGKLTKKRFKNLVIMIQDTIVQEQKTKRRR